MTAEHQVFTLREAGAEYARLFFPDRPKKEKKSAAWRAVRRRFDRENRKLHIGGGKVSFADDQSKPIKAPVVHLPIEGVRVGEDNPWEKIKFNKETFFAAEVVILVKPTDTSELRLFLSDLKQCRMYKDDQGGILIRPVTDASSSTEVESGTTGRKRSERASASGSESPERRRRVVKVTLGGRRNLNPAAPDSQRYFALEEMITTVMTSGTEMMKKAAKAWSTATGKPEKEWGIASTPSNIRLIYKWWMEKLKQTDAEQYTFKEDNGQFKVVMLREPGG